ncbi:alpha/beta fold hydrolase [Bradyrhizobium australafricanum]|uniref:alpha/beta fold hydrolase n=1 Tax=Bradyrhizobium australafricanum TaxID=2821406 RepID=UPI001CE31B5B|nr:alpha/beta fold hydrolase [Bradyrhizobium australafricanum]MCA6104996.1 alpha/beta fold hydrolase [Bradyrhizobium australafricanum]
MTGLDGTHAAASVVALHCSLGSGRQWTKLAAALGGDRFMAPDISGYGVAACGRDWPRTLDGEIARLEPWLAKADGPIHLIGHSYGGTIAFRLATASPYAQHVRSLTLIEPVLPALLRDGSSRKSVLFEHDLVGKPLHTFPDHAVRDTPADARLYDRFARIAQIVSRDIVDGAVMEAVEAFTAFWAGSGPREQFSPSGRLRMIEQADKLPCDFAAALDLDGVTEAARGLKVPTLLMSGGLSPYVTQRIVAKLAALIDGAELRHLPGAGHMLPVTHADRVNPEILRHIWRAEDLTNLELANLEPAKLELAADAGPAEAAQPAGSARRHLVFRRPSFWE